MLSASRVRNIARPALRIASLPSVYPSKSATISSTQRAFMTISRAPPSSTTTRGRISAPGATQTPVWLAGLGMSAERSCARAMQRTFAAAAAAVAAAPAAVTGAARPAAAASAYAAAPAAGPSSSSPASGPATAAATANASADDTASATATTSASPRATTSRTKPSDNEPVLLPFPTFPPSTPASVKARALLRWWLSPPPQHPRHSKEWYRELLFLCVVFAVTGSSALWVVRSVLGAMGISASLFHGEALHRVGYVLMMFPTYSAMMLLVGTLFGRHTFAKAMVSRMWGRFGRLGRVVQRQLKK